jgi:glycosyltransferase involved in cell wall biosynthesis
MLTPEDKKLTPIRVCQIWEYYLPTFTGAAIRHNNLYPLLHSKGVVIEVLTSQRDGACRDEVINGIPIYRVPTRPFKNKYLQQLVISMRLCWELFKRRSRYDVVHSLSTNPFFAPIFVLAKVLGKPVILDFTIMESAKKSVQARILDKIAFEFYRLSDAFVGVSIPLIHQLTERGLPSSKCHLIPVGIFLDTFTPPGPALRAQLREEFGLIPNVCYLIFVGSFLERKGVDILIEMMTRLRQSESAIHLIVVGKHEFSERYRQQVRDFAALWKKRICEYGLESYIHLTGEVGHRDIIYWLQASDIFVFPSRREGFPRVIVEAMAAELPCVCTPLDGAVYEIIEPDVNGIVVEEIEADAFARQVVCLASDPALRQRLGERSRQTVLNHFDERDFAASYRNLFEEVLNHSNRRGQR